MVNTPSSSCVIGSSPTSDKASSSSSSEKFSTWKWEPRSQPTLNVEIADIPMSGHYQVLKE